MPLIIHIQTLLKLNLPYCDLLLDCNATSFSHAFSGKHRIFPLSSAWTIQKGGGMPVFRVGGLCCFIGYWNWDAGWLYAWPLSFSSTSELGSLSTLIPSLAAAFHSLPPSLKTQPSQLPQAIEGQSGAFKGTVTAAIILLSHGKSIFSPTVRVWEDLCSYSVPIPSSLLFMYDWLADALFTGWGLTSLLLLLSLNIAAC